MPLSRGNFILWSWVHPAAVRCDLVSHQASRARRFARGVYGGGTSFGAFWILAGITLGRRGVHPPLLSSSSSNICLKCWNIMLIVSYTWHYRLCSEPPLPPFSLGPVLCHGACHGGRAQGWDSSPGHEPVYIIRIHIYMHISMCIHVCVCTCYVCRHVTQHVM